MSEYSLTICICAYNASKFILETLESVFKQTRRDFALVVIDDASTDDTKDVCEAFFREHHWTDVRVVTLPENGGLAAGRRYAETHCETEFLGFIDADDVMLPTAVERMMTVLESDEDCLTVSAYCEYMTPEGKKMPGGIFIGPTNKEAFMSQAVGEKRLFMPPMNISRVEWIRKAGCRAVDGFPPGKPRYRDMCEDLDLWTRMSDFYAEGKYLVVIPEVLFRYRKMPTSMSANGRAMSMRMRHIKCNLKRRRRGETELTFVDYLASLTRWQKMKYAYSDWSQGFYKQAGFHYMQKHYLRFLWNFGCAALFNPGYFLQKMKHNRKANVMDEKQNNSWIQKSFQKYRHLFLYCLIGGTGASLDFVIYSLLQLCFGVNYQLANLLSVSAGIVNNFFWNAKFNFKTNDHILRRFCSFYLIGMLGCAISAGCLYLLIIQCKMNSLIAKILTIGIVTVVQFLLNKFLTFKRIR